ncbi:MAG: hypothetical protein ACSW8D_13515 [Prevotella sp.]
MIQRKILIYSVAVLALLTASCGGRRHSQEYYEQMIDSIRKAEQVKEIERQAGISVSNNPVEAWFDTLRLRTLPIRNAGDDLVQLGDFVKVPMAVNEYLGYPVSAKLRAMALPRKHRHDVLLVAEMQDSITPTLYIFTMDKKHNPIDQLCIYDKEEEKREDDFGENYMEYFVTSNYEITVMFFYQSRRHERKPELLDSHRYIINRDGEFEETFIEL